jgi:NAD(P)-dependent dehydrogenase (short-subunit alcohol dehydrogenase family)
VDARYVRTDVSSEADVIKMVDTAVQHWGHLDYAANVAGICQDPPTEEQSLTTELFDRYRLPPL